jgi:cytoskeletal protein CcmA (bactofilin family)
MNTIQTIVATANVLSHRFYITAILVLPLLSPVHAQAPDAKPTPALSPQQSAGSSSGSNVYRANGNVSLAAPVKGDFYAAGGRVTVDQPVAGDATLAGGSVTVKAAVGDDLRAAGGDVKIESKVGGELYVCAGNITLSNSAVVADAVTLFAGNINIEGKLKGPLKIYARRVVLNAEVAKDVELNAEEIELGPQAKLGAGLRYPVDAQFKTAEGVVIGGAVTRGVAMNGRPDTHHDREWHGQSMGRAAGWAGTIGGAVASFVGLLAAAALFLLVFTGFSRRASSTIQATPWPALAAGIAVLLGTPMLAMLLLVTLIGIPLGIALIMIFPLMLLMGWVVGVFGIAQRLQHGFQKGKPSGSRTALIGFFALTLLLVLLVGSIPFIGFFILLAVLLLGLGACALELYRQVRPGHHLPDSSAAVLNSEPGLPTSQKLSV